MFKGITLNELKNRYDCVVIGSGIGGLVCANYLAKAGFSVLVVERHFQPGGYCTSFKRKGYSFDAAAHIFSACGPRELIGFTLHEIGAEVEFNKISFLSINFPDYKIHLKNDVLSLEDKLKDDFSGQTAALEKYLQILNKVYYRSFRRDAINDSLINDMAGSTYKDLLNRYLKNQTLKNVLSFLWLLLLDRPENSSALSMLNLMGGCLINGMYRITGGAQLLPNELCNSLGKKGGSVILSKEVKNIIVREGKATGVILDKDEEIAARVIISNADAMLTFIRLIGKENLPKKFIDQLYSFKLGENVFELYLGVNDKAAIDYEGFYFDNNNISNLISVFVSTKHDKSASPAGRHNLVCSTVFPYKYDQVKDWKETKAKLEDETIERLNKFIPGIKGSIEIKESATPKTYNRYTLNYKGSAMGWSHCPRQVGSRRLHNKTPIRGLFLAGHWTQPGGGIQAVVASGKITAKLVLESLEEK